MPTREPGLDSAMGASHLQPETPRELCSEYQGLKAMLLYSLAGLISLVIVAWPASRLHTQGFESEFARHSLLLGKMEQQQIPLYSIWYLLQKLIVGSHYSESMLSASGLLLIGAFATLKGVMLTGFLRSVRFRPFQSLIGGILLGTAVALPIPFIARFSPMISMNTYYLGTIPANTFMSATQLVANVASLPAFFALQLWALKSDRRTFSLALSLCFLATLAKPGIAPALFVAIAGCIIWRCWALNQWHLIDAVKTALAGLVLLTPSAIVSHFYMSGTGWNSIKAVFAPFATWHAFSAQIGIDFVSSFAFPFGVLLMLVVQTRSGPAVAARARLALRGLLPGMLASLAAVLLFICWAEKVNDNYSHSGNFIWAAITANAGWHLNSLIAVKSLERRYRVIPLIPLCLEAIGGFIYLAYYVRSGTYA